MTEDSLRHLGTDHRRPLPAPDRPGRAHRGGRGHASLHAGDLARVDPILAGGAYGDRIHVGHTAIAGRIAPGGDHEPDEIAERLWRHHTERTGFQVRIGID